MRRLLVLLLALSATASAQDLPGPGEGVYTWEQLGDAPVDVVALDFAPSGAIHAGTTVQGERHRILAGSLPGVWIEVDNNEFRPTDIVALLALGPGIEGDTLVASNGGFFLRTTDGGAHWDQFDDFDPTTGGSVSGPAPDQPHGFLLLPAGHDHAGRLVAGYAAYSDDRGGTWTQADKSAFTETDFRAGDFDILPSGRLLGSGYWGVATSDDGGESWQPTDIYAQYGRVVGDVLALATPGSQQAGGPGAGGAIAVGYQTDLPGLRVYRTADDGETWSDGVPLPQVNDGVAGTTVAGVMALAPGADGLGRAIVVVGRGFVYGTGDGGATWDVLGRLPVTQTSAWVPLATLGPDGHLWVSVRQNGPDGEWLYRSAEPAESGVVVSSEASPDGETGLHVRPNPSAGQTRVALSLAAPASHLAASVYDALGRQVAVLHDGPADGGPHAFAVDAGTLAPGVYVVIARADGAAPQTARLTVVR